MASTTPLNLYQKMLLVSTEVMNVEKKMTVGEGTSVVYKAVADLDVVLAVKKAESKFGIISIPVRQEIISSDKTESAPDKYGKVKVTYHDVVKMTVRFINAENPAETLEVEAYGRGLDSGDKGFGKASTYARKYCLLNAYKIATGEDPDKDASPVYDAPQQFQAEPQAPAAEQTTTPSLEEYIAAIRKLKQPTAIKGVYEEARKHLSKEAINTLREEVMNHPEVKKLAQAQDRSVNN
ncbi:MAG: ERF family protein [Prevotella sp.]|nr:ERF family protein [Prevotella sp.]